MNLINLLLRFAVLSQTFVHSVTWPQGFYRRPSNAFVLLVSSKDDFLFHASLTSAIVCSISITGQTQDAAYGACYFNLHWHWQNKNATWYNLYWNSSATIVWFDHPHIDLPAGKLVSITNDLRHLGLLAKRERESIYLSKKASIQIQKRSKLWQVNTNWSKSI